MDQSTINKLGLVTKIVGGVLFIACAAAMIWSLTQPPVTKGPMPDPWQQNQSN